MEHLGKFQQRIEEEDSRVKFFSPHGWKPGVQKSCTEVLASVLGLSAPGFSLPVK